MRKLAIIGWILATVASANAQGWSSAYDAGLAAAKISKWSEARVAFKQAVAYRPEDASGATVLTGPVSERRNWRNGAPYSPNFLAAYAGYKQALALTGDDRAAVLKDVTAEFEGLLAKNQFSSATFYYLNQLYLQAGATEKRLKLEEQYRSVQTKMSWRVDGDGMAPEDAAAVATTYQGVQPTSNPSNPNTNQGGVTVPTTTVTTPTTPNQPQIPVVGALGGAPDKFALIIGNSESKIPEAGLPYAGDDAQKIREALQTNAGYLEGNIDLVINATADQIRASVTALAARIPDEATVFIYFTGVGANLDGKDYLAGVDTASTTDSNSMVAKAELYRILMQKGAKVYAFFQVNRPIVNGRYFGSEVPMVGRIAQVQATLPGASVYSYVRGGKTVGIYTDAIAGVLAELRANRIPIQEFGWQVFYRMRRSDSGIASGGSNQTCTLPVLINIGSDSRF